jgi:hypothetical protein
MSSVIYVHFSQHISTRPLCNIGIQSHDNIELAHGTMLVSALKCQVS